MNQHKLQSAALFLALFGAVLLVPPVVLIFNVPARVLGVPAEVIYLFAVWLGLVLATAWLARRLQSDAGDAGKPPSEP